MLLSLTKDNGKRILIPFNSILVIEEFKPSINPEKVYETPSFNNSNTLIRYKMSEEVSHLRETIEEIEEKCRETQIAQFVRSDVTE